MLDSNIRENVFSLIHKSPDRYISLQLPAWFLSVHAFPSELKNLQKLQILDDGILPGDNLFQHMLNNTRAETSFSLPKLQTLTIFAHSPLLSADLIGQFLSHITPLGNQLRSLSLAFEISYDTLSEVIKASTKLERLDLHDTLIATELLIFALRGAKQLKSLAVSGKLRLSKEEVVEIMKCCESLEKIVIYTEAQTNGIDDKICRQIFQEKDWKWFKPLLKPYIVGYILPLYSFREKASKFRS